MFYDIMLVGGAASVYLLTSRCWPPKAITVLIQANTSSATLPALAYASCSCFENADSSYSII